MLVSINDNKIYGSFFTNTQQPIEYGYDANGNITQNNNKGFTATWNLLDKPEAISFTGNRHIRYVYDATPFFNTTGHACIAPQTLPCPNHWASRLNGNVAERRVGTGIVLRVMAGDTLNYSTRAIYAQAHGSGWNTAQSVGNMLAGLVGAFVGPTPATFDGKAHLLTNGQTIINTTAFQSAIQHQQQNTPTNNTPRAFIKALFFNEQIQLTDSALIRISRGANTVHTYSGQRTAQQNGYVYVYVTNESNLDVWFDDLMVSHRTGPLLQEAHFYPFGQEITPLSSKALLKTPNDRMLQQNEWDEEFGMNLHDFDARMYDASIGRFWGVDVYAEKFARLSPYNYAANNPYHFVDPDGRIAFALAAKFILKAATKGIIKKLGMKAGANAALAAPAHMKLGASLGAYIKTTKGLKIASSIGSWAGGASNVARNWDRITASGTGEGIFRAANFFLAGSAGGQLAAIGTPLATLGGMVLGGALNVEADFITMDGTLDSREGLFRSFSRGALSALSGKAMGKSFLKGANVKVGPDWTNTWWGQGITGSVEKGVETVMANYDEYGAYGTKAYGKSFYWNSLAAGMAGGFVKGAAGGWISGRQDILNSTPQGKLFDFSLGSVGLSNLGGDVTKKFMLKSINKEYKLSLQGQKQGSFNLFFNGFFPMILYHTGAGL